MHKATRASTYDIIRYGWEGLSKWWWGRKQI